MHSSISYSMTTTSTTSVKIGFTMLLFMSLNSASVVISYIWDVSMYFEKTLMFPSSKCELSEGLKNVRGKKMEFWEEGKEKKAKTVVQLPSASS